MTRITGTITVDDGEVTVAASYPAGVVATATVKGRRWSARADVDLADRPAPDVVAARIAAAARVAAANLDRLHGPRPWSDIDWSFEYGGVVVA